MGWFQTQEEAEAIQRRDAERDRVRRQERAKQEQFEREQRQGVYTTNG